MKDDARNRTQKITVKESGKEDRTGTQETGEKDKREDERGEGKDKRKII